MFAAMTPLERERVAEAIDELISARQTLHRVVVRAIEGKDDGADLYPAYNAIHAAGRKLEKYHPESYRLPIHLWTLCGGELGVFGNPNLADSLREKSQDEMAALRKEWIDVSANSTASIVEQLNHLKGTLTEHKSEHSIRLVGDVWKLRFGDEIGEYPVRGNQGLQWLRELLTHPHRVFSVADLFGDPDRKLEADAAIRSETRETQESLARLWRDLNDIEELEETTGRSESLSSRKAAVLKAIANQDELISSALTRAHHNMSTQLRGFFRKLDKDMPRLAAHLRVSLSMSKPDFAYRPEPRLIWNS
jgi:hypothetical protein